MYRVPDIVENGLPIVHIGKLIGMGKRSNRERSAFGQRMLQAREHAKLKQKDVCEKLHISQGTLSGLEGPDQSSSRTVEFARLYRCDPTWLATGEGSPGWNGTPSARPARAADAPPPKPDFQAREFSDSDWALLVDIKVAATDEELKAIRSRAAIVRALADREIAARQEAASARPISAATTAASHPTPSEAAVMQQQPQEQAFGPGDAMQLVSTDGERLTPTKRSKVERKVIIGSGLRGKPATKAKGDKK